MADLLRLLSRLFADLFRSRSALGSRAVGASPADHCVAPRQVNPIAVLGHKQVVARLGLPTVSECPKGACDCSPRYRIALAPRGLSIVLALEVERLARSPCSIGRNSQLDPRDKASPINCGARRGSMVTLSNSGSTSVRAASPSTWSGRADLHHRYPHSTTCKREGSPWCSRLISSKCGRVVNRWFSPIPPDRRIRQDGQNGFRGTTEN